MSRVKQRANRRMKGRNEKLEILRNFVEKGIVPVEKLPEEKIDLIDSFGLKDTTPYLAISNLINSNQLR